MSNLQTFDLSSLVNITLLLLDDDILLDYVQLYYKSRRHIFLFLLNPFFRMLVRVDYLQCYTENLNFCQIPTWSEDHTQCWLSEFQTYKLLLRVISFALCDLIVCSSKQREPNERFPFTDTITAFPYLQAFLACLFPFFKQLPAFFSCTLPFSF